MKQNARAAILFMCATSLVFSVQDGISRHLSATYNVYLVVMLRYWFFGALVLTLAATRQGGIRKVAATRQMPLHFFRVFLLIFETMMVVWAFTLIGLAEAHAIFAAYPLIAAGLSVPILGERVGWRRWAAILFGFAGVLVILQPGSGVVSPVSVVAFCASAIFALYTVLTRLAARRDPAATNFFYTGLAGMVWASLAGIWNWEVMSATDYLWMLTLCFTGTLGHFTLIRAVELGETATVQPFAYGQLVFASAIGVTVFGDVIDAPMLAGAAMIVAAGLFTIWRAHLRQRRASPSEVPSESSGT